MADDGARLTIELEAKIDKLQASLSKANQATYAAAANMSKALKGADDTWNKLFSKQDAGKAIDRVFDRSRLGLLQAGGSQLRVFGSALEPLGVAGLVAAGGVAAFGVAVREAMKAGEWAEELKRTATQIGLSTGALQEFDAVALRTGIPIDTMREALSGLNEKIGQVQSGIARSQTKRVFEALGISPEQLRSLGSLQAILPVIAQKLSELPASEREGLASRLDITKILPALVGGKKSLDDLTQAARDSGEVLQSELIEKGAEAAEKMRVAADVIDKSLKGAFIELEPAIAAATVALAGFINLFANLGGREIRTIENIAQAFVDFGKGRYQAELDDIHRAQFAAFGPGPDKAEPVGPVSKGSDLKDVIIGGYGAAGGPAKVDQLVPDAAKHRRGARGPHDARDDTAEKLKESEDTLADAEKELAETYKATTKNARAQGAFEIAAINAEAAKKTGDNQDKIAKLLADKGIEGKDSDAAQARLEKANADIEAARQVKVAAVQRDTDFKIEDQQIEVHKQQVEAMIAELQSQADITTNATTRAKLERDILKLRQQLQSDLEGTRIDRAVLTGELSPAQGAHEKGAVATTQGAEAAKLANQQFLAKNPLAQLAATQQETYGDVGKDLQNAAVSGIETFNKGLADMIVNFKSLKEVGTQVIKSLETALIESLLNKVEGALLKNAIGAFLGFADGGLVPAFADGGRIVGPGSTRSDSILAAVSHGEFIVNADSTTRNLGLLQAINEGRLPRFAAGGLVGQISQIPVGAQRSASGTAPSRPMFDLRGAVITEDLLKQMDAIGQAHGDAAVQRATLASRAGLATASRQDRALKG